MPVEERGHAMLAASYQRMFRIWTASRSSMEGSQRCPALGARVIDEVMQGCLDALDVPFIEVVQVAPDVVDGDLLQGHII